MSSLSIVVGFLWTAFGTSIAFSYSAVLFSAGERDGPAHHACICAQAPR